MHPEIVAGVNFISTSEIYSNIPFRAIDEKVDGVTGMRGNIPQQNCSLEPEKAVKAVSQVQISQRPGLGATGQIFLTNLSYYLITLICLCFKKLGNSLSSQLQWSGRETWPMAQMDLVNSLLSAARDRGGSVSN